MFVPWGVSSIHKVVGTGKKKTGCRRRNVIKEDLVAQEDEAVKDMVSSLLKGPYVLQRMVPEEAQQWLGSNGSSVSNLTLLITLHSTTTFEKFVPLVYYTTSLGVFRG